MEDTDIKCDICGITFWSKWSKDSAKSNRARHIREIHASPQSVQCQDCGKKFSRKDKLKSHVKAVHSEEKSSYSCTQCDKSFAQKPHLKRHVYDVHKGLQRYYCPECPEDFSRQENLKRHLQRGKHAFLHDCIYCYRTLTFKSKECMHKHVIRYGGTITCLNAKYAIGKMPTEEEKEEFTEKFYNRQFEEGLKSKAEEEYRRFTDRTENYEEFEEKFIRQEREQRERRTLDSKKRKNNEYDADDTMLDPYSKEPIQTPVRNNKCGHVYDKESFLEMTKEVDKWTKGLSSPKKEGYLCRVKSCTSRILCLEELEPDTSMAAEIEKRREKKRQEKERKKQKEAKEYAELWERRRRNREEKEEKKKNKRKGCAMKKKAV